MAKRRTKKEKIAAIHQFAISWKPGSDKSRSEPVVKRQFRIESEALASKAESVKNARLLAKESTLEPVKRDIVKSLILASLILASEVVIYLAWLK